MTVIPFDKRQGTIWFNGEMVKWQDAKVHVLTHGLHYGSSVFEGERAYKGKIFKTKEHTERFRKSANLMDFDLPFTDAEIIAAKDAVVAANGGGDLQRLLFETHILDRSNPSAPARGIAW